MAVVPAPPAVRVIALSEAIVPASVPATPPELVVVLPSIGRVGVTPDVTVVTEGVASPSMKLSL